MMIDSSDWTIWIVLFSKGPVYTITKYQQNPNCYAHGVNRNEPIENMQLYMGYSSEKLGRRLGLN